MSNPSPDLSVVIPVFQEQETLEKTIFEIVEILTTQEMAFEIVAVDDGSTDGTLTILQHLQTQYDSLRIVHHLYNRGYGSSLRTGIHVARGEIIVCMDADGQHSAGDIPLLLNNIPPFELVVGYRTENYRGPWFRNVGNRFYNVFASWLANTEIKDLTSGFRALRRTAAMHFLPLYPTGFSASATVTLAFLKAGYNVTFVPINVQPRLHGKSKVNLIKDGWRFLTVILRMILLFEPLRIFLPLAGLFTLLGFLGWGLGILAAGRLLIPNSSVLLFVLAVMDLLLGLLSSQVANSRIHYFADETVKIYESPKDWQRSGPR
jgi:glycosyltransferase involved in cell wall biosynthesis